VIALLAWVAEAFAGSSFEAGAAGTLKATSVDEFDVLAIDFDRGYAALKIVHTVPADPDGGSPIDCAYPGMKKWPKDGVTLALWDLGKRAVAEQWVIYAVATSTEECSPAATNEANLTAAKARFAAVGLDITKPPTPITAADGRFALVGGDAVLATHHEEDGDNTRHAVSLQRNGATLWEATWSTYMSMTTGDCGIDEAYVSGAKAVFVGACRTGATMRTWEEASFALSPTFDLVPTATTVP
jgi:hypothetical protein